MWIACVSCANSTLSIAAIHWSTLMSAPIYSAPCTHSITIHWSMLLSALVYSAPGAIHSTTVQQSSHQHSHINVSMTGHDIHMLHQIPCCLSFYCQCLIFSGCQPTDMEQSAARRHIKVFTPIVPQPAENSSVHQVLSWPVVDQLIQLHVLFSILCFICSVNLVVWFQLGHDK